MSLKKNKKNLYLSSSLFFLALSFFLFFCLFTLEKENDEIRTGSEGKQASEKEKIGECAAAVEVFGEKAKRKWGFIFLVFRVIFLVEQFFRFFSDFFYNRTRRRGLLREEEVPRKAFRVPRSRARSFGGGGERGKRRKFVSSAHERARRRERASRGGGKKKPLSLSLSFHSLAKKKCCRAKLYRGC